MKYYCLLTSRKRTGAMSPWYRKRFWTLIPLLALAITLAAEEEAGSILPSASTQAGPVTIQRAADSITVSIAFRGPIPKPTILHLAEPERIAFDFVGVVPQMGYQRIEQTPAPIAAIRMALRDKSNDGSPVTRIVLDLDHSTNFETATNHGRFNIIVTDHQAQSPATPLPREAEPIPSFKSRTAQPVTRTARPNTLNALSISHGQDGTTVVLELLQPAKPRTLFLSNPARFVLDLPDVGFSHDWRKPPIIPVNSSQLTAVRSSLFRENPSVVRVVLDQPADRIRPQVSQSGSRIVITYPDTVSSRVSSVASPFSSASPASSAAPPCAVVPVPSTPTSPEATPHRAPPTEAVGALAPRPVIVYQNGLLSIDSRNAALTDVLYEIGEKTGAAIQMPMNDAMLDRVALKMGPAVPRQVIATLLEGSGFTYFFVEDSSGHLQKVILTPK